LNLKPTGSRENTAWEAGKSKSKGTAAQFLRHPPVNVLHSIEKWQVRGRQIPLTEKMKRVKT